MIARELTSCLLSGRACGPIVGLTVLFALLFIVTAAVLVAVRRQTG